MIIGDKGTPLPPHTHVCYPNGGDHIYDITLLLRYVQLIKLIAFNDSP